MSVKRGFVVVLLVIAGIGSASALVVYPIADEYFPAKVPGGQTGVQPEIFHPDDPVPTDFSYGDGDGQTYQRELANGTVVERPIPEFQSSRMESQAREQLMVRYWNINVTQPMGGARLGSVARVHSYRMATEGFVGPRGPNESRLVEQYETGAAACEAVTRVTVVEEFEMYERPYTGFRDEPTNMTYVWPASIEMNESRTVWEQRIESALHPEL
ncbi:hypothetical protein, partial [Halomarina rubra]